MDSPKYLWIQTRDGSPTLWSNELSESFRSVKGAFTESWAAFLKPALEFRPKVIGEFGLGPGTNWILWSTAAKALGIETEYFVIEKDLTSFELGRAKWASMTGEIQAFLAAQGIVATELNDKAPLVFESLQKAQGQQADFWFHDPFGFDVNPDGYSLETLTACEQLWRPKMKGVSYACNRGFRETLEKLPNIQSSVLPTGGAGLKRERLEFWR